MHIIEKHALLKRGHTCMLVMSDSATPWTVACQATLSKGLFQAGILEWVIISSSTESSQLRD